MSGAKEHQHPIPHALDDRTAGATATVSLRRASIELAEHSGRGQHRMNAGAARQDGVPNLRFMNWIGHTQPPIDRIRLCPQTGSRRSKSFIISSLALEPIHGNIVAIYEDSDWANY